MRPRVQDNGRTVLMLAAMESQPTALYQWTLINIYLVARMSTAPDIVDAVLNKSFQATTPCIYTSTCIQSVYITLYGRRWKICWTKENAPWTIYCPRSVVWTGSILTWTKITVVQHINTWACSVLHPEYTWHHMRRALYVVPSPESSNYRYDRQKTGHRWILVKAQAERLQARRGHS